MKGLSIVGTAAMFLVGGGILVHGFHPLAHFIEGSAEHLESVPVLGGVLHAIVPALLNALVGILLGALVLVVVSIVKRAARGLSRSARA
jgi:predicted DNA repair protein MutK